MLSFEYRIVTKSGGIETGVLQAVDLAAAQRALRAQGARPLAIKPLVGPNRGATSGLDTPLSGGSKTRRYQGAGQGASKQSSKGAASGAPEQTPGQGVGKSGAKSPRDARSSSGGSARGMFSASVADTQDTSASGRGSRLGFGRKRTSLSADDVLRFTAELSVMLKAGLPLDRAIKVQIDGAEPGPAAQFLMALLEALKGGKALSVGLEQFSESFGTFYINMVRSGEASGRLDTVLAELGGYLERSKAVRSSVVSAMIYPAILAVVAIISVAVMLGFVVPEFESLFEDMGDALPLMTRFILALGDFVSAWGWLAALVLTALGIWLKRWFDTPGGKGWLDQKLLALPVMGAVVNKYQVALFARTLGTLLGNGVPMLRATEIAVGTVDNQVIHQSLAELAPVIKRGGRLSDALDADIFSSMAIQMVNVGEESGSVDHMLMELAQVYESEVEAGIKRSLTLLEPALILGMGGVIAVIIMGILMGILSVNNMAV